MSSDGGAVEQQNEVPIEDALEQQQEVDPADVDDDESRARGDDAVVQAPEGEFPADARGLDGSTVEEILRDRGERLAEENRPDMTEVSNAGREFDGEKGMFHDEPGFDEAEKKYTLDET